MSWKICWQCKCSYRTCHFAQGKKWDEVKVLILLFVLFSGLVRLTAPQRHQQCDEYSREGIADLLLIRVMLATGAAPQESGQVIAPVG
jgi:hypothetical protein